MHLFKKSGPIRPLPAGIPIDGTNYTELRKHIRILMPILDEQIDYINSRTGCFTSLNERQREIHIELDRFIAPEAIGASESWLMEFNDQRCAMQLKEITLTRLLDEQRDKLSRGLIQEHERISSEYTWNHWAGFLDNYAHLQYLSNRMLKELADYEHGKWFWIQNQYPILSPPLGPAGGAAASKNADAPTTTTTTTTTNDSNKPAAPPLSKKPKHVRFERRVEGWYFTADDMAALTGKGRDDKERRNAAFHERLVDGKATTKALVAMSYRKKPGYERCTEGFELPKPKEVPREYRLSEFRKAPRCEP